MNAWNSVSLVAWLVERLIQCKESWLPSLVDAKICSKSLSAGFCAHAILGPNALVEYGSKLDFTWDSNLKQSCTDGLEKNGFKP